MHECNYYNKCINHGTVPVGGKDQRGHQFDGHRERRIEDAIRDRSQRGVAVEVVEELRAVALPFDKRPLCIEREGTSINGILFSFSFLIDKTSLFQTQR